MGPRNFGIVIPSKLFRSGKYLVRELKYITQQHNIEQVIDLRNKSPLLVTKTYQRIGLDFKQIPLSENAPLPPGILEIWDRQTPTVIHCWKGAHRTGAWIAKFRRSQGWSETDILAEMMQFGFGDPAKHPALYRSIFK